MQVILGVLFHFIGGFASGSFYIPYKKVKGWHWESYWIVGGLFSWLIVPPLAAWLTIPDFSGIIESTGVSTLFITFFFGLLGESADLLMDWEFVISVYRLAAVSFLGYVWCSAL
jgi:L-rhamnose-H+ transport protein